jgi:hypothetical protein
MSPNSPQDGPTIDIKHLHQPSFITRYTELTIPPHLSTARNLFETRDGLDDFVGLGTVDL